MEDKRDEEEELGDGLTDGLPSPGDRSDTSEELDTSRSIKRKELERKHKWKVRHLLGYPYGIKGSWERLKEEVIYGPPGRPANPKWYSYDREMHLCLLRTCRQVYIEANRILWGTNVFSLYDGYTFSSFINDRSLYQKGLIKKLRLVMKFGRIECQLWNDSLTIPLMKCLHSLRMVWLVINERHEAAVVEYKPTSMLLHSMSMRFEANREGIRTLATLPLTDVSVAVTSNYIDDYNLVDYIHLEDLWTRQQQDKYADAVRTRLLDADGVKLLQQELEADGIGWRHKGERRASLWKSWDVSSV